jgi:hypothetical protein
VVGIGAKLRGDVRFSTLKTSLLASLSLLFYVRT